MDSLRKLSGPLCFAFLLLFTAGLAWFFVYRQWHIVTDALGFWFLVGGLVGLAFLFSAVEAGFSVSSKDGSVSEAINPDLAAIAGEWTKLSEKSGKDIDALSHRERRRRNRLERRRTRLSERRRVLLMSGGRRIDTVGSLSALSVFANTALAAFLPTFVESTGTLSALGLEFESSKALIFVASALPIIYFGKIIPKTIGLQFPAIFAYRLFPVGKASFYIIGWMPRGLNWLLGKLGVKR